MPVNLQETEGPVTPTPGVGGAGDEVLEPR